MLIRSETVLAQLSQKARRHGRDRSRHILCPACRVRTRLYVLSDGRRKCGACGRKFSPDRKSDDVRLKQCADCLLCFCLDFPAQQAADITGHRYRLVSALYDRFRALLAAQTLVPGKIMLITEVRGCPRGVHDSAFCKRCKGRFRCKGHAAGDAPVFGVKILQGNRAFIEPLTDDEASFRFDRPAEPRLGALRKFSGYAGFICRGSFHRFQDNERGRDGAEQMWSWMSAKLRRHHGIRRRNMGMYLKELEWKYNHRDVLPERQAAEIAAMLPDDFFAASYDRKPAAGPKR